MLWKEQCERDGVEREPGLDELRTLFQMANLQPRGQFYLRPSNKYKFMVPGANVKYNPSWKEEWVVVEGDWGRTAFIGGAEHPVSTQFSLGCSWTKSELSAESDRIIKRILKRGFTNARFPLLDPFEGARLEKYLRVPSLASGTYFFRFCLFVCFFFFF